MRNKNNPSGTRPNSKFKKQITDTLKPARKSRTKTRKQKFLSLRLQLWPENIKESGQMSNTVIKEHHHHQLNLFPLHPEHAVEDKDAHDENMAYFFSAGDGGATTLTGLLSVAGTSSSDDDNNTLSPSSLTYAYGGQDNEEVGELVRTALKNKVRDPSEEKWVCYSEVVERKEEEVSSCGVDLRYKNQTRRLSLKLDYQEILNAWSDKGPLYIHAESPQTVPDLHDDLLSHSHQTSPNVHGGVWRVPELMNGCIKIKEEIEEEWKMMGHREASVLRYKEKRQNRLFSKKIRYQVRKLNAEKRPRIKGRFVKRN